MIVKYSFLGDVSIVCIPEGVQWEFASRSFNDKGNEVYGLYLIVGEKEYTISEADTWCSGRDIPDYEVGFLHESVMDVIFGMMSEKPELKVIDMEEIIHEMLSSEYRQRWVEKGYIQPDENGHW